MLVINDISNKQFLSFVDALVGSDFWHQNFFKPARPTVTVLAA